MTRIIPWTLPPVKGGSIGGYTERGGGSGGDTPAVVQYFDFTDALIQEGNDKNAIRVGFVPVTNNFYTTGSVAVGNSVVGGTLSGIEVLELSGVSTIVCVLEGTPHSKTSFEVKDAVSISIDPATMNMSFRSGSFTALTNLNASNTAFDITKYSFYVYNGNGEIMQTQEVVPE